MIDLQTIQRAADRLQGQVLLTPCVESRTLSQIVQAQVFLKFENLQFTASFKERGACNKLAQLSDAERARGVVAMSAGNHAQGVAYHAQRLGLRAVIVMPRFTPGVKVERTRGFGAEVVLHGDTLEQARAHAFELAAAQNLTFVHPYDDDAIVAGQGTVGLEMLQAVPDLDVLVIAVGGGGLISGIATAAKALKPGIEVVGVQTVRFPAMFNAIKGTHHPQGTSTIAEGIAVGTPGRITEAIIRARVDDLVLVDEGDIEQAVLMLLEIEKTVVEGAGAAGLAALLKYPERFRGRKVGLVLCGATSTPCCWRPSSSAAWCAPGGWRG
jgi:threonine dehydratase